ncbi:unnamed protein product [Cochlearia groenlandica]
MGRTLSFSLSDPTEAPEYGIAEEEVTSSMVRSDSNSFDPYADPGEMGFTKVCYCGRDVTVRASNTSTNPGRRFLTCRARNDGQCHVWKWWDVAVTEEFRLAHLRATMIEEKLQLVEKIEDLVLKNKTEVATIKKTFKVVMCSVTGLLIVFLFAYKGYGYCGM